MCGYVIVAAKMEGLPIEDAPCEEPILGFHIHAGDMPPLFGAGGRAFLAFMTDRFRVSEVLGRAVVVHRMRDDFHSQPSGDAGEKIGCGIIRERCR
ncbi:MAG: superoxide dismutase family protein [bacterium]|nr:superoxide dismutase family protein [bacterium]